VILKAITEKGYLELPAKYETNGPCSDALDDLYIRVTDLINFVGEVIVSRELSKDQIEDNLEIEPKLSLIQTGTDNIEFPSIKIKAEKWTRLARRLPEQLFYSSVTQMATIYETYLSEIFHEILWNHPELIIVGEKQLTTEEIFEHQTLDSIKFTLTDRKVDNLLFGSYPKVAKGVSSLFKVQLHGSKSPMSLFEIHDFIETRNVIVHGDGAAGELYYDRMRIYGKDTFIKERKSKSGYVKINFKWFFRNAEKFLEQCSFIDEQLTEKWETSKQG
jgi:hypothetical protein